MSSALAIAGVTATLRDLLNDGLINHNVSGVIGSTVTVSVVPPDRVVAANGTEATQLNLFLHQVTPNPGWRNEGLPSRDGSGRHASPMRRSRSTCTTCCPPTARRPPCRDPARLRHAAAAREAGADARGDPHRAQPLARRGHGLPPALRALADSGLADQIEQIKITPEYLDTEEMSKLWTATPGALPADRRLHGSVVLIQAREPVGSPLPVLCRGPVDPSQPAATAASSCSRTSCRRCR